MLTEVLTFIFGFTCGGIVLVLWVLFLLYRFITHMENKATEFQGRKDKAKRDSPEEKENHGEKEENPIRVRKSNKNKTQKVKNNRINK